jgi:short-subunit dehydrogenase
MKNILIVGASRGLGAAFGLGLAENGDTAWLVSRTEPYYLHQPDGVARHWIPADLSQPDAANRIKNDLGDVPLDAMIYNAGIWEASAFSSAYNFSRVSPEDNARIITVNLTAAINTVQALLPNLKHRTNPKVIFIGSTSGMENNHTPEVAYVASKYGLRGAANALREVLRPQGVAVSCLNPGTISSVPFEQGIEAALATDPESIPPQDIVALVKCVLTLSGASCVKEIDLPALTDGAA